MMKFFGAAVAAATLATSALAAVTVTSTNGPDSYGGPLLFNFDATTPVISGDFGIVSGSMPNVYAAPFGDTTKYLSVPIAKVPGSATVTLGGSYNTLSFYWGSIDTYNSIEFFDAGGFSLGSVGGGAVPFASADGNQTTPANSRRVYFDFGGPRAASFTVSSNNYAFELDSIAGTVPEPATWAMLLVGMGLVGSSMRRRRSVTTVAA